MFKNRNLLKAISTPLSSIFGSGFLIIVPILAGVVGRYSVEVMALVCLFAFAVGSVIRFNIKNAEPSLALNPKKSTLSFERISDFALIIAYVISVCLYLHILSSFVLGGFGMDTELNESMMTTVILGVIIFIGLIKGLAVLNVLEKIGLLITLAVIVLLVLSFGVYDIIQWQSPEGIQLFESNEHSYWEIITIVSGTLIVVQGFETTRYLGKEFSAEIRIQASKYSQLISTIVYLVFILVALPIVHALNGNYGDNGLIELTGAVSMILVFPLIISAVVSQFSAAVADAVAALGNMEELTKNELSPKFGGILIGGAAIILTWSASTPELIAIASRGFAFYYFMQCLVALSVSKTIGQKIGIGSLATMLLFVTFFAVPAG